MTRRGRATSTLGGLSALVELTGDGAAASCRSATMAPAPTPTTTTKTITPIRIVKFSVFRLLESVSLFAIPPREHAQLVRRDNPTPT